MEVAILATMVLGLGMFLGTLFHGYNHVRQSIVANSDFISTGTSEPSGRYPEVAVIVPVTGNSPGLAKCLETLLNQDFPDFNVFFVTSDMEDPASSVILDVVSNRKSAQHVIAGPATRCCQKNHNLLAGLKAAGDSVDILVFCDSSHEAPSTLLSDLITPIVKKNAITTTGFHRILPGDSGVATLGMMLSVLTIHLVQGNSLFTQPWGGATAIRRSVFMAHGIDRLWSKTVVDDFTMGPYLRKQGIMCKTVSRACLSSPVAGESMSGWIDWLTRQLLYLKFCIPGSWLAASAVFYLLVAPALLSITVCLGFFLGLLPVTMVLAGFIYLIIWTAIGMWIRKLAPIPVPLSPWLFSFYVFHFIASWCYIKTWFTNTISWRGISYRVTWGGKVKGIISDS